MASTIMVIDDSISVRKMISFTLENAGYIVIEAENGRDAMEKLEIAAVNLFIVDLNMPGIDGFELIRTFRATDAHRFTPIIMLTTESQAAKKVEARAAGATGWITKPFKPDQLINVAKKLITVTSTGNECKPSNDRNGREKALV